ncbi:MAG TPA: response regulator transcription factor [Nocardioides sp.]|uniref:response regulator transcription factor n=1 Tax=uncultured Nocardioides sp. TaxID=198441 RepID=UPI000EDCFB38|nr:response regulator transcription factor [uncultured Nocardioides sp.]HCB06458.1 helix-turn-helix transcriptional regulator [Nocardioides sp.]HRD61192.1 response regulator transcription factor [Nocardioides sp.]HRI95670.1 response regulator transcription factor [Nocardioides sp.]HRK45377.1 response regulator transcription factor [Nocardioides sp.]
MTDPAGPVRVALVNDHMLVVKGLAAMLAPFHERVRLVELDSRRAPPKDVDVVLKDAFGMVDDLREFVAAATSPVVVFALTTDRRAVDAALEAGAAGYVSKGVSSPTLVTALERVHAGERVLELNPGDRLPNPEQDWPGHVVGLSNREAEVLSMICRGMSNPQIAEALYLGINTIKTYARTLYRAIGVTNRAQAVVWGVRHGFAPRAARIRPDED